jgi:ABC-type transporter Mla maintaining outer membrane lipid asymmetry ATPase subunit MlaF
MSHDMSTLYELHSVTFHIESKKIHWSLIFERVNKKEDTPAIDIFFWNKTGNKRINALPFW